ncbi:MAG: helix-turn-helix domain-containing protein [Ruminococcus sp.]
MHLHRNALLYRMDRIQQMLGKNLNNHKVCELTLLSFRTIEYLKGCKYFFILSMANHRNSYMHYKKLANFPVEHWRQHYELV